MILLRILHAFATFVTVGAVCTMVFLLMCYMGLPVQVARVACACAGALFFGIYIGAVTESAIEKAEEKRDADTHRE